MKWELSRSAPCVSTLGLCSITARDQISQAFPSIFGYCKQSKTGGGNGLRTRLIIVGIVSFSACQPLHQFCYTSCQSLTCVYLSVSHLQVIPLPTSLGSVPAKYDCGQVRNFEPRWIGPNHLQAVHSRDTTS